jgi:two-component system, NarL family, response regulator LiaR
MTETNPIRLLIVDDHPVVRSGLSAFLLAFDDLELVGEAGGGAEALRLCGQVRPDVILMDLVMPEMDGVASTRAIHQAYPGIKVIALTSFKEEDLVQRALQAGAISYMLKNVAADELAGAIRLAHAGRSTLAPEATQALVHSASQPAALGGDLTGREREVLTLMAQGLGNREIADRLVISPSTAKFHVSSILSKLGAADRTEAVALAFQLHLVK